MVQDQIDRHKARLIAKNFIKLHHPELDIESYRTAIIYEREWQAIRYLQKALGFNGLQVFIKEHDFDLFFWVVRFFKENQKEEYRLTVSTTTGQVTSYIHTIDDNAAREDVTSEQAKNHVINFFINHFNLDPEQYSIKAEFNRVLDNRTDYSFSWKKDSVNIPWSDQENMGTAKLLMSAKVSGNEILAFAKNSFLIPDQFNRYLSRFRVLGKNLSLIVKIFVMMLYFGSIYNIILRSNHLAMHTTKKFYIWLVSVSFLLIVLSSLNFFQSILFSYPTTEALKSFVWRSLIGQFFPALVLTLGIIIPALSGELLHFEEYKQKPEGSFLYYIHSTFLSRSVAESIIIGYLGCFCMLGIQSFISYIGQQYWGVWIEYYFLTNLSTSYLPFIAAFTIGFNASLTEELIYRLFAISWGKKLLKYSFLSVLLSSFIWGLAHSGYPVFPMWFRGVEVTILGLFLGYLYLRHGLITVLTTHYLFDVFWNTSSFLFGTTITHNFIEAWVVLILPFILALFCFMKNKVVAMRPLKWHLNLHQEFNLEVLKSYLTNKYKDSPHQSYDHIKKEFSKHGWDLAVVEIALEDLSKAKEDKNA